MLSQKKTNGYPLTTTPEKMSLHYLVKNKTFYSDWMLRSTTLCWNSAHVATRRFSNSSVSRIGIRYTRSYSPQTRLYEPHLRWDWSRTQRAVLTRRVADSEAATSDPQHCWRRVCLPARQCASTSCSWHSRASAPWDTLVHQSWHVASQQSWPQPGITASGACYKSACIEYQSAIWTSCGRVLLRHGPIFSRTWWTMQLISGKKRLEACIRAEGAHFALNTCCDVACLTVQLPHITTDSFQSHQCFEECNITFSRTKKSFAFYEVMRWHFSGVG